MLEGLPLETTCSVQSSQMGKVLINDNDEFSRKYSGLHVMQCSNKGRMQVPAETQINRKRTRVLHEAFECVCMFYGTGICTPISLRVEAG
jgi:hypothetical protein